MLSRFRELSGNKAEAHEEESVRKRSGRRVSEHELDIFDIEYDGGETDEPAEEIPNKLADEPAEEPFNEPAAEPAEEPVYRSEERGRVKKRDDSERWRSSFDRPGTFFERSRDVRRETASGYGKAASPVSRADPVRVRLAVVVDGTLSFTKVFSKVYYMIEQLLDELRQMQRMYQKKIEYALIIMRDKPQVYPFSGSAFTVEEEAVKEALGNMIFRGGSLSGYENIYDALNMALEKLNNAPDAERAANGLLLFTDSMDQRDIDFTDDEPGAYGNYTNHGLRFASIYSYTDEFRPYFRMTDAYGEDAKSESGFVSWNSLGDLLRMDEDETAGMVRQMAETILNAE